MSNNKKHNRPKCSLEFKQDAARLVLEKGYSQQQTADHLGISQSAPSRCGIIGLPLLLACFHTYASRKLLPTDL